MMETLYVIGNGFDLHHGLNTKYSDFHRFIAEYNENLENELENYFAFEAGDDFFWSNFEKNLETFDWKAFFDDNCHVNALDEDFKPSYAFGVEDSIEEETERFISKIQDSFEDWIRNLDIDSVKKKLRLKDDSFFINFNYTMVLEEVYKIRQESILHIHGDIECNSGEPRFGHNKTMKKEPELDKDGNSNRTMFTDSENAAKYPFYAFRKPVKDILSKNKKIFKLIQDVKSVYVLGHSLNKIDLPYFRKIRNSAKDAIWYVSYYEKHEKEEHLLTLNKIGIARKFIKMVRLTDLSNTRFGASVP